MKKILICLLCAIVCCGCEDYGNQRVDNTSASYMDFEIDRRLWAVEFEGHEYIIYEGYHEGGIIHSPNCKCLK